MTSSRDPLAAAVKWLKDDPNFKVFLRSLYANRDKAIELCLAAQTTELAEVLRLEARAYGKILRDLKIVGVTDDQASSGDQGSERS